MSTLRRSGGVRSDRPRSLAALVAALALVAGCQGSTATSAPTGGRSPTASASLPMQPPPPTRPTAEPTATPSDVAGHWEAAGTMAIGRADPHAILLGDGRVLVVGNETGGHRTQEVLDDSATAEVWDPATGAWHTTESLNKPRGDFVAVPLVDGRVLVTGGLNQTGQSYSSTYVYDPRPGYESWSKVGLLGTARTAPIAAVLPDGRVLLAGGWYQAGPTSRRDAAPDAILAAYRPGSLLENGSSGPPLADVAPEIFTSALATAELFDPATGSWSATGPLNYARLGAAAVTLADGRVLVVGSNNGERRGVAVDERAYDSAEIYDPKTGRFSLAGRLPTSGDGALVALDDGGALLVDNPVKVGYVSVRSIRFDARTGRWTQTGRAFVSGSETSAVGRSETSAVGRMGALVARLADGRVLVAGGLVMGDGLREHVIRSAELYDPTTEVWSPLPPMPEARAGGATVALTDGSVLLVGGWNDPSDGWPMGLTSAIRFVPSP